MLRVLYLNVQCPNRLSSAGPEKPVISGPGPGQAWFSRLISQASIFQVQKNKPSLDDLEINLVALLEEHIANQASPTAVA